MLARWFFEPVGGRCELAGELVDVLAFQQGKAVRVSGEEFPVIVDVQFPAPVDGPAAGPAVIGCSSSGRSP